MKRTLTLILALMLLLCSAALAESPEGYPEVVEGIDFGGATITIYDYWTSSSERVADPDEETAALYAYRDWLEETYNCKIVQIQKGDWNSQISEVINFVAAGQENELCFFILDPGFTGSAMSQDYFAAWNTKYIDFSDELWNPTDLAFMTRGGQVYGVATGAPEPRQCMFFNKNMLENIGIDWNTIYDMQENGTWTWEAFEGILNTIKAGADTDNDGLDDMYGLIGSNFDFYLMSVFSNGASFFEYNDAEELKPVMNSDAALEGLNWSKRVWSDYSMPQPADAQWDWYKEAFKAGKCAFYIYNTYGGFNDNSELSNTDFEWGCVAYPKGPQGDVYLHAASDNITVIPNVYKNEETVAQLAFIYSQYMSPTPGYDDEYAWIGQKYNYTDERAVDDTYAMLRELGHTKINYTLALGSNNDVLGSGFLWDLSWREPAELIEEKMPVWNQLCDDFNSKAK